MGGGSGVKHEENLHCPAKEPGTPGIWERKMTGLRKTLEGAESTVGLVVPLCWAISP